MSEPNSASDPTPPVPPAPSFTYGDPAAQPAPPAAPLAPPQYGERLPAPAAPTAPAAPPAPGYAPAYGVPAYGTPGLPPVKRRRTWDLVLTIILLVVGLFGMIFGLLAAVAFTDPSFADMFDEALGQQGIQGGEIDFSGFAAVVAVSHVVLYLIALGVGILLLAKNKVAFWVPLSAGVVAAIVFWGGYFVVIFSAVDLTSVTR